METSTQFDSPEVQEEEKTLTPRVFEIPESNYEAFVQKFERLQRRAAKLGCSIDFTVPATEDRRGYVRQGETRQRLDFVRPCQSARPGWTATDLLRRFYFVTVTGDRPKLAGWTFVGSVEVVLDEAGKVVGNMLRLIPDATVPEQYRKAAPWCDHCNIERHWHETFIIRHDDGTFRMVGRRCLKDFTGHQSPEAMASFAEMLLSAGEMADCAEDEMWEMGGSRGEHRYDVESLLVKTAAIVRIDGWKPSSFEMGSTKSTLACWINAKLSEQEKWEKDYPVSDVDRSTAASTLDWMLALGDKPSTSDYEHNLNMLARAGAIEWRGFGLLASAVSAWMRAHDRAEAAKKETTVSDYVGTIKSRIEMDLTLVSVRYTEGVYGTKSICKYNDQQGNVIMWFYSGSLEMEVGTRMRAKATIMKHEVYRSKFADADSTGVKQTIVSRLKVVTLLDAEGKPTFPALKVGNWGHGTVAMTCPTCSASFLPNNADKYAGWTPEQIEKLLAEDNGEPRVCTQCKDKFLLPKREAIDRAIAG